MPFSFKLEFPCSNNTSEYEAYLTGLAITLSMGIKHMRVLEDSNLVVSQVKKDVALREPSLASSRTWVQKVEKRFQTFSVEYTFEAFHLASLQFTTFDLFLIFTSLFEIDALNF